MKTLIPLLMTVAITLGSWQNDALAQEKEATDQKQAIDQKQANQQDDETKKNRRPRRPKPPEWTERYDKLFLERTPMLDDYAPDASGFDEAGNEFELSDTQGKYTVIVFGCLT